MLSKDDILKKRKGAVKKLDVPEWGEGSSVFIRTINGFEALKLMKLQTSGDENLAIYFASVVLCDEGGKRLFSDDESQSLADLPIGGLIRIMNEAVAFNNLSGKAIDEQKKS
jgi:hypothetical protein